MRKSLCLRRDASCDNGRCRRESYIFCCLLQNPPSLTIMTNSSIVKLFHGYCRHSFLFMDVIFRQDYGDSPSNLYSSKSSQLNQRHLFHISHPNLSHFLIFLCQSFSSLFLKSLQYFESQLYSKVVSVP